MEEGWKRLKAGLFRVCGLGGCTCIERSSVPSCGPAIASLVEGDDVVAMVREEGEDFAPGEGELWIAMEEDYKRALLRGFRCGEA